MEIKKLNLYVSEHEELISNNHTNMTNLDFMDDQFFKQTPAELRGIALRIGLRKYFFEYNFTQLSHYASENGIPLVSGGPSKKRILLRRILNWHKSKYWQPLATEISSVTGEPFVELFDIPMVVLVTYTALVDSLLYSPCIHTIRRNILDLYVQKIIIQERERQRKEVIEIIDSEDEETETEIEVPDELVCVVCKSRKRNIVYNDCHHFVCCSRCSNKCGLKCPVCRTVNKTKQQVYM